MRINSNPPAATGVRVGRTCPPAQGNAVPLPRAAVADRQFRNYIPLRSGLPRPSPDQAIWQPPDHPYVGADILIDACLPDAVAL